MTTKSALSGIRVLDVTQAYAGPFCSQLLADYGADVIKVEGPAGDINRQLGPRPKNSPPNAFAALFQHCNRNKRGIVIDLKTEEGKEVFLELVKTADVLIENFRYGVMERLGLNYEVLSKVNPRLVYTSIRGYGDNAGGKSPWATFPAVDMIAQAYGGIMSITGPDENTPTKVGGGLGDTVPGLWAAYGTMLALFEAQKSGKGQYVDIAMADAILAMCEGVSTFYGYSEEIPHPSGNRLAEIVPFGTVRVKDGIAAIAVPPGRGWAVFCEIIGRPDLIENPEFATIPARVKNTAKVYEVTEAFTSQHSKAELMEIFGGKVPFSPIMDAKDIHNDPHFAARQMLVPIEHPGTDEKFNTIGVTAKLSRTPGAVRHRAPTLGEHTDAVLQEAGFSKDDLERLHSQNIIK